MTRTLVILGLAVGLSACTNPMNLTYDFGRAYNGAFQTQADLSRPTVAAAQYRLSGLEGTLIRIRTSIEATDAENSDQTILETGL